MSCQLKIKNTYTLLDPEDYEIYSQWKWGLNSSGYARRTIKRAGYPAFTGLLHRLIMQPPKGMEIDHINGNKLDNRRANLRLCTRQQNLANQRKQKGTSSSYRGVYWDSRAKRWIVDCRINKHFADEQEAAKFYDRMRLLLHGEFYNPNFPEDK